LENTDGVTLVRILEPIPSKSCRKGVNSVIKASQILGLIAGIGGSLLASLIILSFRGWRLLNPEAARQGLAAGFSVWSYLVFMFALVGIVGAALVRSNPRLGGILMLVSGACGVIAVILAVIAVGGVHEVGVVAGTFSALLIASGILALPSFSGKQAPTVRN
jgi:hypothetical protein